MYSSSVSVGDIAMASQYNNLRKDASLFSGAISLTYDSQGRIATLVNTALSITLTLTYSVNYPDQISSATDGTKTWTFNYNAARQLTSITEA